MAQRMARVPAGTLEGSSEAIDALSRHTERLRPQDHLHRIHTF